MKPRNMALLGVASLLVVVVLAVAVKVSPDLQSADLQAALWVNHLQLGEAVSSLMVLASLYGREYFWITVVGVMMLFGDRRTKAVAVGLAALFVVGIVSGELSKEVVARARPSGGTPVVRIPLDTDFSFPSGHALIVSIGAVYSLITFKKKWLAGLLTVEAAFVCFSRVYTFEHFPTDVIGGVALGAAIVLGGLAFGRVYLIRQLDGVTAFLVRLFRDGPLKA